MSKIIQSSIYIHTTLFLNKSIKFSVIHSNKNIYSLNALNFNKKLCDYNFHKSYTIKKNQKIEKDFNWLYLFI